MIKNNEKQNNAILALVEAQNFCASTNAGIKVTLRRKGKRDHP
jgi:hypothetical protein